MKFDVIIVGAGAAGASAALELTKDDLSVLVIEKLSLPREKPCAGAMSRSVEKLLGLDLSKVIKNRAKFIKFYNNYQEELIIETSGLRAPILVNRSEFDLYLLNKARTGKGEIVIYDQSALSLLRESNDKVMVKTKHGQIYESSYLIAADGAISKVATFAGLMKNRKFAQAVEVEIYTSESFYKKHEKAMTMNFFCVPEGYGWIFPKEKGHFSCGIGTWGKHIDLKPYLNNFLHKFFKKNCIKDTRLSRHPIPVYQANHPIATNRILLTGDAAALTSPVTGEGIRFALQSGKIAASIIRHTIKNQKKLPENFVSEEYQRAVKDTIEKELNFYLTFASLAFHGNPNLFYKTFIKS